jgi:hypothetical protein
MCDVLYIASDRLLPLVKYDEGNPTFWVGELGSFSDKDSVVKRQFLLPYVYYVGSHTFCGCGFSKRKKRYKGNLFERAQNLFKKPKEMGCGATGPDWVLNTDVNRTYKQLVNYLREAKRQQARLELFSCYDGLQGEQPDSREIIHTIDIESPAFTFGWMKHYELID